MRYKALMVPAWAVAMVLWRLWVVAAVDFRHDHLGMVELSSETETLDQLGSSQPDLLSVFSFYLSNLKTVQMGVCPFVPFHSG